MLFAGEAATLANPRSPHPIQFEDRVRTLVPGRARGPILGGNLTILSTLMGSDYLPSWEGSILFVEDEGEVIAEGIEVEVDAEAGTIRMLEPAVT